MTRLISAGLMLGAFLAGAAPATAQTQGFSLSVGYFAPRGENGRTSGDVLNADRCIDTSFLCEPLLFDIKDFGGATFGGEYLIGIGDFIEVGAGVGYYQRTVPSIYEFVTRPDGSEIDQDLKLRVVPITGTVKVVPTGLHAGIQPYFGAGIAALRWYYSETGDFVDPVDGSIFRANFASNGTKVAPIIFGGVRGAVGANFMLGGEVRYQRAEADLSTTDFLGDKIDLGGTTFQATLTWKF